ncbi:PEP-CTERM sorting domain-containing protein [Massilia sp. YIM B04103]|uniref:PEP-CTERM sorting domain-containing protein n=1 Tax=Massilia sp. YIM B04103 TaxID=2963106 RepID=UPI00210A50CA|nr:PEP-CTERM sorting domain-containing protein [Massilia sp. YIM B04103]
MHLPYHVRTTLAGMSLGLVCLGADAAPAISQVHAGFRDLRLSTVDLTPTDGSAAGFQIMSGETLIYSNPGSQSPQTLTLPLNQAGSILDGAPNVSERFSTSGAPGDTRFDFAITATGAPERHVYGAVEQTINLKLQAHSLLTVNGTTFYSHNHSWVYEIQDYHFLRFKLSPTAGIGSITEGDYSSNYPRDGSYSNAIGFVYANASDKELLLTLELTSYFGAHYIPRPVPEPASYGMLGLGLGLLGYLTRRRSKLPA